MPKVTDRRTFIKATGVAGITALAGCSGGGSGDEGGDGGDDGSDGGTDGGADGERISWHAGGTGGTYYPLSGEVKTIVEANTPHSLQVQSTGASVENVGSLAGGTADFALIQNDVAYFAKNGVKIDAFKDKAIQNLRGVATLYPETITVVTRPGANIESLTDLEGKTVNTGDLGSGTQVNALQILNAVGLTTEDFNQQNTSFSVAADQIQDGDADAAFVVGGWPVGAIEELATTSEIDILEIDGDTLQTVLDSASWFAEDTIPAGTYNGITEDVSTVSVQAMIATRKDYSAEIVEEVTRALFENLDELTIKTDFISKESAQDGMSIELHEGAKAYFG